MEKTDDQQGMESDPNSLPRYTTPTEVLSNFNSFTFYLKELNIDRILLTEKYKYYPDKYQEDKKEIDIYTGYIDNYDEYQTQISKILNVLDMSFKKQVYKEYVRFSCSDDKVTIDILMWFSYKITTDKAFIDFLSKVAGCKVEITRQQSYSTQISCIIEE